MIIESVIGDINYRIRKIYLVNYIDIIFWRKFQTFI